MKLVWLSLLRPCSSCRRPKFSQRVFCKQFTTDCEYRKAFPNIMEKRKFGRKLLYQCSSESIIVHCFTVGSVCLVECIDGYPPKQRASSLVIIYLLPWMIFEVHDASRYCWIGEALALLHSSERIIAIHGRHEATPQRKTICSHLNFQSNAI